MIGIFDSARSARLIAMSRAEIDRMNVLHDLAEGRIKPGQHDRLLRSRQNQQKRIRRTTDKTERMNLQWVRHEKNCQKILAVLPGCFFGLQSPGKFKSLSRIPYAAEQGIILTEQGNLTQEQRILLVNTKLIPDQVFDIRRGRRHQGFGLDGARRKKSFFQAVLRPLALSSRGALAGLIANELRTMLVRQQAFVRGLF